MRDGDLSSHAMCSRPLLLFVAAVFAVQAGAELVDDLSAANTIFGVKEFPKEDLLANKSYMIFSHTIKAQEYNMPFLDACLQKRVRLFDYETIRAQPPPGVTAAAGGRLVAFGKFAGYAGMIDCLRGVGERLLSLGYSSPFMGVSSSYMYPDLPTAKAAIAKAGEEIKQYGLPTELAPMRFVFTGTGNVARGAQEIFELLPHKYVTAAELATLPPNPHLVYGCIVTAKDMVERIDPSQPFDKKEYYDNPTLYRPVFHETIAPHMNVLVNWSDTRQRHNSTCERRERTILQQRAHFDRFLVSLCLCLCLSSMYWDSRFPRLITNAQMKELETSYNANPRQRKFMALADITCDIGGSVEFLKRSTTIDNPFFMYNPLTDEVGSAIEGRGVLVLGVDNLPAEFPKDASQHFSQALKQFAVSLSECDTSKPFKDAGSYLPPEIYNSCITADGALTPAFNYIAQMRAARSHSQSNASKVTSGKDLLSVDLMLEGHLFDTGFINQALDAIETHGHDFEVVQWVVSPNRVDRANNVSRAVIHVTIETQAALDELFADINTLALKMPKAHAKLVQLQYEESTKTYSGIIDERNKTTISFQASGRPTKAAAAAPVAAATPVAAAASTAADSASSSGGMSTTLRRTPAASSAVPRKKILVLGSGFVAGPLVEYLHRRAENFITVASAVPAEAERLVRPFAPASGLETDARVTSLELNVGDTARVRQLISRHDLVVSLLPATLHPDIARVCIELRKDMVTASYVSPLMQALHESAKQAGISILNEMGLDPGLDHMACMQIIEDAHKRGSKVLSFRSLCGGLPAPECANNPFAYKFSWSPLGMLLATQNNAVFKEDNKLVELPASRLLLSAKPLALNPAFSLEYYANRDSLSYTNLYGIPEVESMFRGTIRYTGTAKLLHGYAKLGLLNRNAQTTLPTAMHWQAMLAQMLGVSSAADVPQAVERTLRASGDFDSAADVRRVVESMEWLGLLSSNEPLLRGAKKDTPALSNPMELLCSILQEKLQYAPGERDMVVMYHEFLLAHKDGSRSVKKSSLISYGGDDAVSNTNPLIALTPGGGGKKG